MDAAQIAHLLVSDNGKLAAAGALFLAVWALKNYSPLKAWMAGDPRRVKLAAALLAVLPAVALALTTPAAGRAIAQTALVALFGAMGIHSALKK